MGEQADVLALGLATGVVVTIAACYVLALITNDKPVFGLKYRTQIWHEEHLKTLYTTEIWIPELQLVLWYNPQSGNIDKEVCSHYRPHNNQAPFHLCEPVQINVNLAERLANTKTIYWSAEDKEAIKKLMTEVKYQ